MVPDDEPGFYICPKCPDEYEFTVRLTPPHSTRLRAIARAAGVPNVATLVSDLIKALVGERFDQ